MNHQRSLLNEMCFRPLFQLENWHLKFLLFKPPGTVLERGSLLFHKWNACCCKKVKQFIRSFFRLRNNKGNTYWIIMVQAVTSLNYKLVPSNWTEYGNSPFVKCDVEYSSHERCLNLSNTSIHCSTVSFLGKISTYHSIFKQVGFLLILYVLISYYFPFSLNFCACFIGER